MENRGSRGRGDRSLSDYSFAAEVVAPELSELMKDQELAAFFRFVQKNDLREEALALLEEHIEKME